MGYTAKKTAVAAPRRGWRLAFGRTQRQTAWCSPSPHMGDTWSSWWLCALARNLWTKVDRWSANPRALGFAALDVEKPWFPHEKHLDISRWLMFHIVIFHRKFTLGYPRKSPLASASFPGCRRKWVDQTGWIRMDAKWVGVGWSENVK